MKLGNEMDSPVSGRSSSLIYFISSVGSVGSISIYGCSISSIFTVWKIDRSVVKVFKIRGNELPEWKGKSRIT
jgi:hypothetical protein